MFFSILMKSWYYLDFCSSSRRCTMFLCFLEDSWLSSYSTLLLLSLLRNILQIYSLQLNNLLSSLPSHNPWAFDKFYWLLPILGRLGCLSYGDSCQLLSVFSQLLCLSLVFIFDCCRYYLPSYLWSKSSSQSLKSLNICSSVRFFSFRKLYFSGFFSLSFRIAICSSLALSIWTTLRLRFYYNSQTNWLFLSKSCCLLSRCMFSPVLRFFFTLLTSVLSLSILDQSKLPSPRQFLYLSCLRRLLFTFLSSSFLISCMTNFFSMSLYLGMTGKLLADNISCRLFLYSYNFFSRYMISSFFCLAQSTSCCCSAIFYCWALLSSSMHLSSYLSFLMQAAICFSVLSLWRVLGESWRESS